MRTGLSTQKHILPKGNVMRHKILGIILATFGVLTFAAVSEGRDNGLRL
jgi:hypothetical protein